MCVCVMCVCDVHSLSNSNGGLLSVDGQLILETFHFSPHLWDVQIIHDDTTVLEINHTVRVLFLLVNTAKSVTF